MSGRRPKPTALKLLQGNPGGRALNADEPKFSGSPACPKWLTQDAKTEWHRVAKELKAVGMLTKVDQSALAGYCQSYSRWKEAELLVTEHGLVITEPIVSKTGVVLGQRLRRNPSTIVASDCLKSLARYSALFGLDPSSRSRLHVSPQEAADPFDEYLNADNDKQDEGRVIH